MAQSWWPRPPPKRHQHPNTRQALRLQMASIRFLVLRSCTGTTDFFLFITQPFIDVQADWQIGRLDDPFHPKYGYGVLQAPSVLLRATRVIHTTRPHRGAFPAHHLHRIRFTDSHNAFLFVRIEWRTARFCRLRRRRLRLLIITNPIAKPTRS